ncbi:MAG: tetratricopeptide repeat protein [Desulfobacterales bacterium]|nr:tetratricopeptide repeat protein [Desulfobacterales bacterium]
MQTILILLMMLFSVYFLTGAVKVETGASVQDIVHDLPYDVQIFLSGKVPHKIVQLEPGEILIAFNNVLLPDAVLARVDQKGKVKGLEVKRLPDNVVGLFITTANEAHEIESSWMEGGKVLFVRLAERPVKQESVEDNAAVPIPILEEIIIPEAPEVKMAALARSVVAGLPPMKSQKKIIKRKFTGDIDDILIEIQTEPCFKQLSLQDAVYYCTIKDWKKGYHALGMFIGADTGGQCKSIAEFLRALCFFKMSDPNDAALMLKAIAQYQNLLNTYPDSKYIPYAMATLGAINMELKNYTEAIGYFNIILKKYENFRGMPEVLIYQGRLAQIKKKQKDAIGYYQKVVERYSDSRYVNVAILELGKAYYNDNNFSETIRLLNRLRAEFPEMVYESPDMLFYLGNAYYQTARYEIARIELTSLLNLFPDIENNHIILSRIGDTYKDEKQPDKAKKIYELVIKRYPGSDGYVISYVRLGGMSDDKQEKEMIYKLLVNNHSDNPVAKLALIRLADLWNKDGKYEKSVITIRDLLKKNPRAFSREIGQVIEASYVPLFRDMLEKDDNIGLMTLYEKDRALLSRYGGAEVSLLAGQAYLDSNLYFMAEKLFENAYATYGKKKKPPELLYGYATSLYEIGESDDALNYFDEYIRNYPEGENIKIALFRTGDILLKRGEYSISIARYQKARRNMTTDDTELSAILMGEAAAYKGLRKPKLAVSLTLEAINVMSLSREDNRSSISLAYFDLGNLYYDQHLYDKAADTFLIALKYAVKSKPHLDIRFRLAESYHKGSAIDKAEEIYKSMAGTDDLFWGKLAQQKLYGIEIEKKLKNS